MLGENLGERQREGRGGRGRVWRDIDASNPTKTGSTNVD